MREIHIGDIGTIFRLTVVEEDDSGAKVPVDISDADDMKMRFELPDKTSYERDAEYTTDGVDGKIEYVTVEGDLTIKGDWKLQAVVVLPTGTWHTEVKKFKVYPNIEV